MTSVRWGRSVTPERIKELFIYVPFTGDLVWRKTKSATAPAGSIAGTIGTKGHIYIQVDKELYAAHQLVFLLHHGYLPLEIDHINQVKTDNRIENLRACESTARQNKGNIGLTRQNTSGFKGVSLNSRTGMWHAQIKVHGKQTYIGRFPTPQEAAIAYNKAASKYFGEFAYLNEVQ